ncbi:MAG: hypothetical protein S4CHLAM37_08670 [Chlamydiia bacterium]|nr:hypothetical protein [Chlamydiia bacterium]
MDKFQRVMVFGLPGSGKSNFCSRLAKLTSLPLHHIDKHFFYPRWVSRDKEEVLNIQKQIIAEEKWILDGNSMRTLELRFQRADIAILFNFKLSVCFFRMVKRIFRKDRHIKDLPEGCKKSIRYSLIRYLIIYKKKYGPQIQSLKEKYPNVTFLEFTSDQDVEGFLSNVK